MKSSRLELRVTSADKARIVKGAKKARLSITAFVELATKEKADAILGVIGNQK